LSQKRGSQIPRKRTRKRFVASGESPLIDWLKVMLISTNQRVERSRWLEMERFLPS
jgi:hypothetical protein